MTGAVVEHNLTSAGLPDPDTVDVPPLKADDPQARYGCQVCGMRGVPLFPHLQRYAGPDLQWLNAQDAADQNFHWVLCVPCWSGTPLTWGENEHVW
jgi:hypothetical protein